MSTRYVSKLHMAVSCRNEAWVRRLLSEGHNPSVTFYGWSLLQWAIVNGDTGIAILLKNAGAVGPNGLIVRSSTDCIGCILVEDRIEMRHLDTEPCRPFVGTLG